jgi:hypothetical protein
MAMKIATVVSRIVVLFFTITHLSFASINSPELDVALAKERSLQSGTSTVKPFNCSGHSGPLQTIWGKNEYHLNERTLTGNGTIFTIPRDRTSPPFEHINACGINPIDDILYCIINVSSTPYLVRIDESTMEFVSKMPRFSWTAAFSSTGTYFMADDSKYYKVEKAAELIGTVDQNDSALKDHSKLHAEVGYGADMVVVFADFEGPDKQQEYIMTLANAGRLIVTRATGTVKSWVLQSKPELDTNNKSYGAAWAYQNRVFFAQNGGGGMYEVFPKNIDLVAGTVHIEKIGPSFDKGGTDGANCINMEIPSKYSGRCGPKVGAYSALTKDDPFPPPGATNVKPNQELIFLPNHDDSVTGYQVFLGPATLDDAGAVSVEWHLACNLPCGVNVCKPPYGLDNTLGGHFAWRVDQLKADGSSVQGETWQFSLLKSVMYDTRAVADTYIDKKPIPYADKRHMLMWAKKTEDGKVVKNPRFGFVKFKVPPPTYAGLGDCKVSVRRAELRLTVLSFPMKDVMVYLIPPEKTDFNESEVTSSAGNHPGSGEYPDVFSQSELVANVKGPVKENEDFTIDVTKVTSQVFEAGGKLIAFGLETSEKVSRFCAQSSSNPRKQGWCYPKLDVILDVGDCSVVSQEPSCSKPADSPPGPLDAMCGDTAPTFTGTPTNWRENTIITTTTTTTTTTVAAPIKEGHCRYDDHVFCPWPNDNIMCSGDQCCPDQSTCPSATSAQASGCNLKKYDCTAFLPANWTCRESEEVFCPGSDVKCSGDTCCPDGTTCPSASVNPVPSCGNKTVDCQAPLSEDARCAIGEFVFCPATDSDNAILSSAPAKQCSAHPKCVELGIEGNCCSREDGVMLECCDAVYTYRNDKCTGNQCCPDGSTCPSAPDAIAEGCGPKKATCELLEWNVKLRVSSIIFANVDDDTKETLEILTQETVAAKAGLEGKYVNVTTSAAESESGSGRRLAEDGIVVNAKISAPGGWSQKKLDNTVESNVLSEGLRRDMEEMLLELDGLKEASSGDMTFEEVKGERDEPSDGSSTPSPESSGSSTPSPESSGSSTPSPSMVSTSLRGGDAASSTTLEGDLGEEASSATTWSFLPALAVGIISMCNEFPLLPSTQ